MTIDERLEKILRDQCQKVGYLQAINDVMDLILNDECNIYNVSKLVFLPK